MGPLSDGPTTHPLKVDLLGDFWSVVDFDTEISDGTLQLAVTQELLAGAEVSGLLVDQRHLGSSQDVGAVRTRIQSDPTDPAVDEVRVLARPDMPAGIARAREQPIIRPPASRSSHCVKASLAGSVISNGRGRPVLC